MKRPDGDPARSTTVAPGAYEFGGSGDAGSYVVTWWDPHILHLASPASFGLRRDDLIVKDGDPAAVEQRLAEYERWRADRAAAIEQGTRPSVRVKTATAWARDIVISAEGESTGPGRAAASAVRRNESDIEIVELAGASGRPRGPRFGTLVHAGLATVALAASDEDVRATVRTQARVLNSTGEEIEAAVMVVSAVLRHDLMKRARRAPSLRRETPITWLQPDGTLIEGVLDLAFDEDDRTVVVDFKTDHELSSTTAGYRVQVEQYVQAVARVAGRPVSGVLFKV